MKYFIGIFCILHGLVHILYMGHSLRYFELEKGFSWPNHSILFKNAFSRQKNQFIASILCAIAAISYILSGTCFLNDHSWQNRVVIIAVITSTLLFIAFWDGSKRKIHTQGGIAILINVLVFVYTFK